MNWFNAMNVSFVSVPVYLQMMMHIVIVVVHSLETEEHRDMIIDRALFI